MIIIRNFQVFTNSVETRQFDGGEKKKVFLDETRDGPFSCDKLIIITGSYQNYVYQCC